MNIKDFVRGDKVVSFVKYGDGVLHYSTDCGFVFPVPVSDIGDATFLARDRAMLFMRYLRKQLAVTNSVNPVAPHNHATADNADVMFSHFKGGDLWFVTADCFEFPVPIAGCVGEVLAVGPAAHFSSYIVNHREFLASSFRETIEA